MDDLRHLVVNMCVIVVGGRQVERRGAAGWPWYQRIENGPTMPERKSKRGEAIEIIVALDCRPAKRGGDAVNADVEYRLRNDVNVLQARNRSIEDR